MEAADAHAAATHDVVYSYLSSLVFLLFNQSTRTSKEASKLQQKAGLELLLNLEMVHKQMHAKQIQLAEEPVMGTLVAIEVLFNRVEKRL